MTDTPDLVRRLQILRDKMVLSAEDRHTLNKAIVRLPAQAAEIAALRGELEKLRVAQAWQPIETAPKDGSEFLAADADFDWMMEPIKCWRDRWVSSWDHGDFGSPTHWRPLPPAPDAEGG